MNLHFVLLLVCLQMFLVHCYSVNRIQVGFSISTRSVLTLPLFTCRRDICGRTSILNRPTSIYLVSRLRITSSTKQDHRSMHSIEAMRIQMAYRNEADVNCEACFSFESNFDLSRLECLWKVCSWALDKRSAPSSDAENSLSKLLY